jgi:hypothetical protein
VTRRPCVAYHCRDLKSDVSVGHLLYLHVDEDLPCQRKTVFSGSFRSVSDRFGLSAGQPYAQDDQRRSRQYSASFADGIGCEFIGDAE